MKRAFIRGLFGKKDISSTEFVVRQRDSVDNDLAVVLKKETPFGLEYVTYVFGNENYDKLQNMGVNNLRLVSPEPYIFAKEYLLRNKIEMINIALQEFDEIIWLDWDCNIVKSLPTDFWEQMGKKSYFQACLFQYVRRYCPWRTEDCRKVANTGFTYLRGKDFIKKVIAAWETTGKNLNDEIAFSYALDEEMGGWQGPLYYCQQHEPMFCRMKGRGPCPDEIHKLKDPCFVHYFRK